MGGGERLGHRPRVPVPNRQLCGRVLPNLQGAKPHADQDLRDSSHRLRLVLRRRGEAGGGRGLKPPCFFNIRRPRDKAAPFLLAHGGLVSLSTRKASSVLKIRK